MNTKVGKKEGLDEMLLRKIQNGKRLTRKDIYAIVNSVKIVPFDETSTSVCFEYIADSRFVKDLEKEIKRLKDEFIDKANRYGLKFKMSDIWDIEFPPEKVGGEPTRQKRILVDITIYEPEIESEIEEESQIKNEN